jgi:hypothetical protein
MRRLFCLAFGLAVLTAARAPGAELTLAANLPKFADYPVKVYTGKFARPRINTAYLRDRPEAFEHAVKIDKINAGGRYIVVQLPCGTTCVQPMLQDVSSGRISGVFSISGWREYGEDFESIESRADSRLIVFHGARNEAGINGNHYYLIDPGGKLKHLRSMATDGNFETTPKVQ